MIRVNNIAAELDDDCYSLRLKAAEILGVPLICVSSLQIAKKAVLLAEFNDCLRLT